MRLLNIIKKLSTLVICYIIIIIVIIIALIIFAVFYKNKIIIAIQNELYEEKVLIYFQSIIYISCIIQSIINSEILLKKAYKLRDSLKLIESDKSSLNYVDINFLAFALSTFILNILIFIISVYLNHLMIYIYESVFLCIYAFMLIPLMVFFDIIKEDIRNLISSFR